jgi:hypothetical protein
MFLHWAKGEGGIEGEEGKEDKGEARPKRKRRRKEADADDVDVRGYSMAKIPGYGNMSADTLVDRFGAVDFLWYLEEFLLAHSLPIPPSHNDIPFGVYKRMSVMLPQIPQVSNVSVTSQGHNQDNFARASARSKKGCTCSI